MLARLVPALGMLTGLDARAQWATGAWARSGSYLDTQRMWATSHALVYTQRISETSVVSRTNFFLFNIAPTNFTSSLITNTFEMTVAEVTTNGAPTNRTYTAVDVQPLVQTNLILTWSGRIKWDCTMAVAERAVASGLSATNATAPVRFYRDDRAQLVHLKTVLDDTDWISQPALSNRLANGTLGPYQDVTFGVSSDPLANIWQQSSIPTNFDSFTPWRDLYSTSSFFRSVMTCLVTIGTSSTNVITNSLTDCCGNPVTISGTNRQSFTIVCTNASLEPGSSFASYNYYALRRKLTNLVARNVSWATGVSTTRQYDTASAIGTNLADAIGIAYAGMLTNLVTESWFPRGITTTYQQEPGEASGASGVDGLFVASLPSPVLPCSVSVYASSIPVEQIPLPTWWPLFVTEATTNIFDAYGSGVQQSTNGEVFLYRTLDFDPAVSSALTLAITSTVSVATWAPGFTPFPGGVLTSLRGFQFGVNSGLGVAEYLSKTNGFRYR